LVKILPTELICFTHIGNSQGTNILNVFNPTRIWCT